MADFTATVPERTSQKYTFTLKDETGATIPGSSLTTCKLTGYDLVTKALINSRDHVDVKSHVDGAGQMAFTFDPADLPILDDSLAFETHVWLFEWTYNAGASRGQHELALTVKNSEKVP